MLLLDYYNQKTKYNNMDTQTLPLVPFGKYKGQPITTLLNDTNYLEWCKQQEWFQKYPIVYNICVNQTITTNNQNSKTPEHNKLQNLFLDEENQMKLLNILFGVNTGAIFKKHFETLILDEDFINCFGKIEIPQINRSLEGSKIVFEDKYNWDFILYYTDYQHITLKTKTNDIKKSSLYNILGKHNFKYNPRETISVLDTYIEEKDEEHFVCIDTLCNKGVVCCELKPSLGDDYPCVLRKMKTQIELTNNDKNFQRCKQIKFRKYILIIGNFTSKYTTKEDLISIFKQSDIKVIFTHELFEYLNNPPIENTQELIVCENEIIQTKQDASTDNLLVLEMQQKVLEAEDKNKQLEEKLLQAEEKNKQLEEEISSLKSQKRSKNIKDYFGKK